MVYKKSLLKIIPLEERIVLDAAIAAAAVANHASTATANVIFVDAHAAPGGDGNSWAHAYNNLQSALADAAHTAGADQIWIAKGTYTPTEVYSPDGVAGGAGGNTTSHMVTFNLPDNVTLYGGFTAGMTKLSQRNPTLNQTILSGDILGNDINDTSNPGYAASKADNAWHVVIAGNDVSHTGVTATLDGITITNGYANGIGPNDGNGGIPISQTFGGGLYVDFGSDVLVKNVTFTHNFAQSDGGGVYSNSSDTVVTNSTFLSNTAGIRGGGMDAFNSSDNGTPHVTLITNSLFQDNVSNVFGGAIVGEGLYPAVGSKVVIQDNVFVHNIAAEGGAIVLDTLTVNIVHDTFINNIAHVNGGAVSTTNVVGTLFGGPNNFTTTITDSTFIGNIAEGDIAAHDAMSHFIPFPPGLDINFARGGGALVVYMNGHAIANDNTFIGNLALSGDGGAILNGGSITNAFGFLVAGVSLDGKNNTFIGNAALDGNGGAVASVSALGLLPTTDFNTNILNLKNSVFTANYASDNGGAVYLDGANANLLNGKYTLNFAGDHGDHIYAEDSMINGNLSSTAAAKQALLKNNKFTPLLSDSLYIV